MTSNFFYYLFCITAVIVAFLLFKKVTGCLFRSIVLLIVAVILAVLYFLFFR